MLKSHFVVIFIAQALFEELNAVEKNLYLNIKLCLVLRLNFRFVLKKKVLL